MVLFFFSPRLTACLGRFSIAQSQYTITNWLYAYDPLDEKHEYSDWICGIWITFYDIPPAHGKRS